MQNGFSIRPPSSRKIKHPCRISIRLSRNDVEYAETERMRRRVQKHGKSRTNGEWRYDGAWKEPDVACNNLLHPTTCCTPLKILHASPSNFTVNCLFGKKSLILSLYRSLFCDVSHRVRGQDRCRKTGWLRTWLVVSRTGRAERKLIDKRKIINWDFNTRTWFADESRGRYSICHSYKISP